MATPHLSLYFSTVNLLHSWAIAFLHWKVSLAGYVLTVAICDGPECSRKQHKYRSLYNLFCWQVRYAILIGINTCFKSFGKVHIQAKQIIV